MIERAAEGEIPHTELDRVTNDVPGQVLHREADLDKRLLYTATVGSGDFYGLFAGLAADKGLDALVVHNLEHQERFVSLEDQSTVRAFQLESSITADIVFEVEY